MNITETYYLKAVDNYPYNIEESIENLNYALSYDPEYAPALCLMGKLYTNEIKNFELAESFYIRALSSDFNYSETHSNYTRLLLLLGRTEEAKVLLYKSIIIPGIDKIVILQVLALAFEYEANYENATETFKEALKISFTKEMDEFLYNEIKRIEGKQKKLTKIKNTKTKISTRWVKTYS